MSATVTLPDGDTADYPDARAAAVADRHLYLTGAGGRTVAIYAPESWSSVDVKAGD